MRRLRMTVLYEFDYTKDSPPSEVEVDNMVNLFLRDPGEFLGIDRMAYDETIIVDLEDVTDGN